MYVHINVVCLPSFKHLNTLVVQIERKQILSTSGLTWIQKIKSMHELGGTITLLAEHNYYWDTNSSFIHQFKSIQKAKNHICITPNELKVLHLCIVNDEWAFHSSNRACISCICSMITVGKNEEVCWLYTTGYAVHLFSMKQIVSKSLLISYSTIVAVTHHQA